MEDIKTLLKKYEDYKKEINRYRYISYILYFDSTTDCPLRGREYSNEVKNYFDNKALDITLSQGYIDVVKQLYARRDELDDIKKLDIWYENYDNERSLKIPREELEKHMEDSDRAYLAWDEGKRTGDFSKFIKELNIFIEFSKKYCKWLETDELRGFDVILDDMEMGYKQEMYDKFFDKIECDLLPFVKKVLKAKPKYNPKLTSLRFPIYKQKQLTKLITEKMGYTGEVGCIRETTHPYTNWFNNNDVRITTSYREDLLFSNIYSIIHETGHALFQLQMDDKYNNTNIFSKVTCITHESQSRFYENYLGRSRAFIKFLYPLLIELFPDELKGITEDDIYYYVNSVDVKNTIRVEADELTYPFHILIRYNVEKELFSGKISADQIEERFNYYMNKYLDLVPQNKAVGCFQDSHWSFAFGYFPTYAVGSAYGAMFLKELNKSVDVDGDLSKGNFTNINKWLKENIHQYSATRKNDEVVRAVCGREFNPDEYIDYLKNKFSTVYDIEE